MGMFDWYKPAGNFKCPKCSKLLESWQGKDGPCLLLVWREGVKHPIEHRVDEGVRFATESLGDFALPKQFRLYTLCCDLRMHYAIGFCHNGVWSETQLLDPDSGG